jgi:fatty acid desaturase
VALHHAYLGDPERDPDLRFFIEQGAYARTSRGRFWLKHIILPVLGSRTVAYLQYLIDNRFKHRQRHVAKPRSRRLRRRMLVDRVAFFGFWASVIGSFAAAGVLWDLVLFWVVPYLTSFQILGWYIELSEHTPWLETEDTDLHMTRNRRSRGLEKFLTGIHNDHHHLDHHLDTSTPFWHLPRAREIRLRDPDYARIDARTGALFTRASNGAPSALAAIMQSRTAPG